MTNVEIWEWMQRDLDGDLTQDEQKSLFALLEKDADLQQQYNRLKSVSLQLEQLPPVVPSFSIVDSILPKLESAVATPAAKADLNVGVLPTLEVKSKSVQPSEKKKWKNKTVWFARIGSSAVAACLLVGVILIGYEASKQEDPATHGAILTPEAVEPPVMIGPPAPQPSTNPTPPPEQDEEQPVNETAQPPKQNKVQTSSPPVQKTQEPPPVETVQQVVETAPVLPPTPVPREPKPPAFPFGLEEKSDDDRGKKSETREERRSEQEKETKTEKHNESKDQDDDEDDDSKEHKDKKESSRESGRTIFA